MLHTFFPIGKWKLKAISTPNSAKSRTSFRLARGDSRYVQGGVSLYNRTHVVDSVFPFHRVQPLNFFKDHFK